jgi:hypothetical protein
MGVYLRGAGGPRNPLEQRIICANAAADPDLTVTPADLIARRLRDPETSWAIGTFGAIAEFHRDADEQVSLSELTAVTSRGGISIRLPESVRVVVWERPTAGDAWTQGVALCLSESAGAMGARTAVTELGTDEHALREEDKDGVLFDLGIGAPHCDVCVRVDDGVMLRALRAAEGRPIADTGLIAELAAMSPTRVFISRLGRLEVRTPIPHPGGTTPDGPHTHVLPELLRHKRTHAATVPLPEGMVPSAEMFPPSAIHDAHGRRVPFDAARHEMLQALLAAYGDPGCVRAKAWTMAAVRAAEPPRDEASFTRAQRLSRRVALRQLLQTDGPSATLAAWRAAFDRDQAERSTSTRPRT